MINPPGGADASKFVFPVEIVPYPGLNKAVKMIEIKKYDLPDAQMWAGGDGDSRFSVWLPAFLCIVLGQGSKSREALCCERVQQEQIPVYRRPSGGEAVILSPNMLVVSILKKNEPLRSPAIYFSRYNSKIISVLAGLGVGDLCAQGVSDICIGNRKLVGSAIYRTKDRLFYHAVLNVSEPGDTFSKYLMHPNREPAYRSKRPHPEFVTSLKDRGYDIAVEDIKDAVVKNFS